MSIPSKFETTDVLAPGTYEATFPELRDSLLVRGDGTSAAWDVKWRGHLVSNLEVLAMQLRSVGLTELFIDGSFVENKDHPNDIDGYFDTGIELVTPTAMAEFNQKISDLNNIDPYKVWNWDPLCRVQNIGSGKRQIPM